MQTPVAMHKPKVTEVVSYGAVIPKLLDQRIRYVYGVSGCVVLSCLVHECLSA